MIDIKECTGCGACSAICNHRAISMIPDCKGFLRPYVDKEKCVNCRLCDKVCEVANSKSDTNYKNIIALKHNDIGIKQTSTSEGHSDFSQISLYVMGASYMVLLMMRIFLSIINDVKP